MVIVPNTHFSESIKALRFIKTKVIIGLLTHYSFDKRIYVSEQQELIRATLTPWWCWGYSCGIKKD